MERKKTAFSKLFDIVDGIENVVLAIMVIGMVVTIMIQIIGRIIGHPSPWTEETSRYPDDDPWNRACNCAGSRI